MVRMATRRENAEDMDDNALCPKILKRIQALTLEARACRVFKCGGGEFEIIDGKSTLPVSLVERTCICNKWQLTGIPCKHAVRAILYAQDDPARYCSKWYYGHM
jgi:SWIM zinc finger